MKKITLLAASALLLLTACGQTESVAAEVAPPATVVQEDIQQPHPPRSLPQPHQKKHSHRALWEFVRYRPM